MRILQVFLPIATAFWRGYFSISRRSLLLCTPIILICFSISINGFSQKKSVETVSDEQIQLFIQKAQTSGLSISQIEKVAQQQGYSPAEIARIKERVEKVRTEQNKVLTNVTLPENTSRTQLGQLSEPQSSNISSAVFGKSLFTKEGLSFEPNLRIATPQNYQLGPDDELIVDIYGAALDNFHVKVSPEGTVKILNLSPIYVNGLSVENASQRIVSRLRQLYQGLNVAGSGVSAQVTLGNVRSIKVTLTGEVSRPGTYTVSSLATIFNALYAAGGPSENGSFRNIRLIRNNKVYRILDLYDFLLRADQKDNVHLQDQDIIRIGDYTARVELQGEVKRPMIFEVEKTETLQDVLRFAGGFTDKAYTYSIQLKRNTAKELKLINVAQEEVASFIPKSGDKYTIGTILERFENRVKIAGAVFRPGEYAIEKGTSTVKDLIQIAEGLKPEAFMNRASLRRLKSNDQYELVNIDLGKILSGQNPDIPLKREDFLTVYSTHDLQEKRVVKIEGEVNQAGTYEYIDGMTLGDLILQAKGFTEGASASKVELSRRIKTELYSSDNDHSVEILFFDLDKNLSLESKEASMLLMPFDKVYIRTAPNYEAQKSVYIDGEIAYPGSYTIKDKAQRISDLVQLAGGLKKGAYPQGAVFQRDSSVVAIDLSLILANPQQSENLLLLAGDKITIPRLVETVKLTGGLLNPVAVAYREGQSLQTYLSQAGGLSPLAQRNRIFVKYANGMSDKTNHFLFFRKYPKVLPGSEVIVPEQDKETQSKLSVGERIAIMSGISSLVYVIISITNAVK